MSEVLARLRVKEDHGIRRFLYPLTAVTRLKESVKTNTLGLLSSEGNPISLQVAPVAGKHGDEYMLGFGLSLPPLSEQVLFLVDNAANVTPDDALRTSIQADGSLHNEQKRFSITVGRDANIQSVVYDGVSHLRGPSTVLRNGEVMGLSEDSSQGKDDISSNGPLYAGIEADGSYTELKSASLGTGITACKSWATMGHWLTRSSPHDKIVFTLPFSATSSTLTYDVGLEGAYGKIEAKNNDTMTWRIERTDKGKIHWSVATNERMDYVGTMTKTEFREKRWFHLVDSNKALAVAITEVPESFKEIIVNVNSDGEVRVAFHMGRKPEMFASFGICYHFLNDIPAIAAATNPQSILLPPTVEVLPV